MVATRTPTAEKLYTAAEFEQTPEFQENYELIEGRIVKKPMPSGEHSLICKIIQKEYASFDFEEEKGEFLQEISVDLTENNVPIPDMGYWIAERKPGRVRTAVPIPDIAIEMWSEHDWETRERKKKAREKYEKCIANGVKTVWAVNPDKKEVEVYRAGQKGYVTLGINDVLSDDIIAGFKLPVLRLFE